MDASFAGIQVHAEVYFEIAASITSLVRLWRAPVVLVRYVREK